MRKLTILVGMLLVAVLLAGCDTSRAATVAGDIPSTDVTSIGLVDCTTDTDCQYRNGDTWEHAGHWDAQIGELRAVEFGSQAEAEAYLAEQRTVKPDERTSEARPQCEAVTKAGKQCSRRAADGKWCKQHAKIHAGKQSGNN